MNTREIEHKKELKRTQTMLCHLNEVMHSKTTNKQTNQPTNKQKQIKQKQKQNKTKKERKKNATC